VVVVVVIVVDFVVVYIFEFCREIGFANSFNKSVVNILLHMYNKHPVKGTGKLAPVQDMKAYMGV
jgi:hypothetical protein